MVRNSRGLILIMFPYLPGGTKNTTKTSVKITVPRASFEICSFRIRRSSFHAVDPLSGVVYYIYKAFVQYL